MIKMHMITKKHVSKKKVIIIKMTILRRRWGSVTGRLPLCGGRGVVVRAWTVKSKYGVLPVLISYSNIVLLFLLVGATQSGAFQAFTGI